MGAGGFASGRNSTAIKSSSSTNSIASLQRRDSDQQTERDGRWTFRTDLPPPRPQPGDAAPGIGAGRSSLMGSPSLGKRPPPPPPPASRRGSAFPPPPPPPRSREGSVSQGAEVTRYVDETVPKLDRELDRCKMEEDYAKCAQLKTAINGLNQLKTRAEGGGSVAVLMEDYRRLKSEADGLL
ncbi:hypothetical protein HKX48_002302 [Thoreauomyces humboldtii]|nr:hypothetical protein HKX48_002302 [Thoreauomyces humboldtii]